MKNTCPISGNLVDENVIRLNALFVIGLLLISINFFSIYIFIFLTIDFLLRANALIKFSPIARISKAVMHDILRLKPHPIDFAPKKFAAGMGAVFSLILFILSFLNLEMAKLIVIGLFIFAAGGELIFNFCLGCKIYSIIQTLKEKYGRKK